MKRKLMLSAIMAAFDLSNVTPITSLDVLPAMDVEILFATTRRYVGIEQRRIEDARLASTGSRR